MLDRGEPVGMFQRLFAPSWVFVNTYFFRLGLLDGIQGYYIAQMAAHYVRRKYSKWARLRAEAGKP